MSAPTTSKPPRTRLFNGNDRYTDEGLALDHATANALRGIVATYRERGFSLRDIEYVMSHTVTDLCLDEILKG